MVEGQAPVLTQHPVLPTKTASGSSETDRVPEGFMVHHYSEGETLPGLAIRYLVTVPDIKRANGFSLDRYAGCREVLICAGVFELVNTVRKCSVDERAEQHTGVVSEGLEARPCPSLPHAAFCRFAFS